jgi:hypothetical protein
VKILAPTPLEVAKTRWNLDAQRNVGNCGCVLVMALNGPYFSRLCFLHRPRI